MLPQVNFDELPEVYLNRIHQRELVKLEDLGGGLWPKGSVLLCESTLCLLYSTSIQMSVISTVFLPKYIFGLPAMCIITDLQVFPGSRRSEAFVTECMSIMLFYHLVALDLGD